MAELVTFVLGERTYALPISAVREVVRLAELATLPGMTPPLAGLLDLRGLSLPVLDIRPEPSDRSDVLVLVDGDREYGFACDRVTAVVAEELLEAEETTGRHGMLPPYVVGVLRSPEGPVFSVDVSKMIGEEAVAAVSVPAIPANAVD